MLFDLCTWARLLTCCLEGMLLPPPLSGYVRAPYACPARTLQHGVLLRS